MNRLDKSRQQVIHLYSTSHSTKCSYKLQPTDKNATKDKSLVTCRRCNEKIGVPTPKPRTGLGF